LTELDEEETHAILSRPADTIRLDAICAGVGHNLLAERIRGQARHPGRRRAHPHKPDGDIELGACNPELERVGLLEALRAGWRQANHRLAECHHLRHYVATIADRQISG
jgi:hypothetical protein